jgi:hypothetical protein
MNLEWKNHGGIFACVEERTKREGGGGTGLTQSWQEGAAIHTTRLWSLAPCLRQKAKNISNQLTYNTLVGVSNHESVTMQ